MTTNRSRQNLIDLFFELVRTDFVLRYRNSILGVVWVLLKPFLLYFILLVVFSWFFKGHDSYYRYNLFSGIIIFSFFSESTQRGVVSLWEKASILLKVNFPKELMIYTSVVNSLISFFASFTVYFLFWQITKPTETVIHLSYFLLQLLILACLVTGLNFFLSLAYIFFRDLSEIWEILLRLIFYSAPIIYPYNSVPENFRALIALNPVASVIIESRKALIGAGDFAWGYTFFSLAAAVLVLIIGRSFFYLKIKYVAEKF